MKIGQLFRILDILTVYILRDLPSPAGLKLVSYYYRYLLAVVCPVVHDVFIQQWLWSDNDATTLSPILRLLHLRFHLNLSILSGLHIREAAHDHQTHLLKETCCFWGNLLYVNWRLRNTINYASKKLTTSVWMTMELCSFIIWRIQFLLQFSSNKFPLQANSSWIYVYSYDFWWSVGFIRPPTPTSEGWRTAAKSEWSKCGLKKKGRAMNDEGNTQVL